MNKITNFKKQSNEQEVIGVKEMQLQADKLIEEMKNLDFKNYDLLLPWLSSIQPYTGDIRLSIPTRQIVNILEDNGYISGENCGQNFNENDKENFARYIVGQCLDGLGRLGSIHPIIVRFTDDWMKKFIG